MNAHLFMVDSNRELCKNNNLGWGCVSDEQTQWIIDEAKKIDETHGNSTKWVFMHIPPRELLNLVNSQPIYGNLYDSLGCPLVLATTL